MMLTHVNVNIHSAALYRPLVVQIAFHVRYSWLLCIVYTQFTSEYNYSTFDKTKPMTQQGDTSLDPKMHHLDG